MNLNKNKLVFGLSIDLIFRPHITTNQHELDMDNVDKLFDLIKHNGAFFLPLIPKSIGIHEKPSNQILYFDKEDAFEQTMEISNYIFGGQLTPYFLKRLKW
jgi:hypothetical protein